MPEPKVRPIFAKLTGTICIGIVCILLVAGLSPFHAPKNRATWLQGENGIELKRPSSLVSAAGFEASPNYTGETLELLLQPNSLRSTNAILAFDGAVRGGVGFAVRQYKQAVVVRQPYIDAQGVPQVAWLAGMDAFAARTPVLITVASSKQETSIYLDGLLKEKFQNKGTSINNLTGRMVVGNSTEVSDSWPGQVLGLAMYRSQLTAAQIAEHYAQWTERGKPEISSDEAGFALYSFNERQGDVVHNQLDPATNLLIPGHYFLLHPRLFSSLKQDYKPTWQYWEDVGVNIAGFIPFGLFAAIYFSRVRRMRWPLPATIVFGFLISLMIEGLQFLLPTRSSGSTDLITNTLGTIVGVMVYRSPWVTRRLDRSAEVPQAGSEVSERHSLPMSSKHYSSEETALSA